MPVLLRLLLLAWAGGGLLWAAWPPVRRGRRAVTRLLLVGAFVGALQAGRVLSDPDLLRPFLVRVDASEPPPVDAIFVFSGDVDFHRTLYAVTLFRKSGARWFVVSGQGAGGDSGELMAQAAEKAGVPRTALLVEGEATTTRENVVHTAPLLHAHGIRKVIAVTSPWHSRRAGMSAERAWAGVEVVSMPVPEPAAHLPPRELLAFGGYALRLWL